MQFSRKYSIREIQDRWYSLLYDPVISAEASAGMTNFELSASPLPSKFYRFGHSKEQKVVSAKRKSGSVRNLYYARLKRIRNSMLTSMDLSFLVDPGNGNYVEHGSDPLYGNCMPEAGTFNLPAQYDFPPENVMDDNVASDGVTASVFFPGVDSAVEENLPAKINNVLKEEPQFIGGNVPLDEAVEDLDVPGELTLDGWIGDDNLGRIPLPTLDHINNDPENMCPDFDEKNAFDSTELECGTSFNLASLPEIPVWSTDEGIREPDMPCDGFNDSIACGEAYLEELSNSLLNFSSEEELFLMDVDGEEGIDKSYFDGLSSLLLNSTNDVNPSQVPEKDETESQVPKTDGSDSLMVSQAHVLNQSVSCHKEVEDNPGSTSSSVQVVHKLNFQISSSPLTKDPLFHELTNEVPSCSLNTEEQEIPDNEDVFLPFDVPPVIFPASSKLIFKASKKPISSCVQDYGFNKHRASERGKTLMHVEKKIRLESQSSSQMMGSPCLLGPDGGSKVKCELPANYASHMVSTSSVAVSGGLGGNDAANTTNALLRANKNEEATNPDLAKDQSNHMENPFIKKSAASSNDLRNHPQLHGSGMKNEQDLGLPLQEHQLKCAEVGSSDVLESELVADPLTLDEEEQYIESDDELPSYSDVEAMVSRMAAIFPSVNSWPFSYSFSDSLILPSYRYLIWTWILMIIRIPLIMRKVWAALIFIFCTLLFVILFIWRRDMENIPKVK